MSTKISQLTSAIDVTANDLIQVVDVEDGVMAPSGTNKKATASLLAKELAKQPLEPGVVISGSSSGDAVRITQTGSGNALVVEDSTNPDATPFVVDSNGRVVIGDVTSRTGPYGFQRGLQITNTSAQLTFASNDQSGNAITFAKSRGTPNSPNVAVQSGDVLGSIAFTANDGSGYVLGSQITSIIDGTAGSGDIPSCLTFGTSADETTGLVERMRITSAGNVGIGTSAPDAGTKLDVVGTIRSNELVVQNTSGPARIEVGGEGNVYIDLKKPSSDDYDLRIQTDSTISSILTREGQNLVLQQNGDNVGIGTVTIESNCLLKLESTTKGFRPPSMTTTQRDAIATPIAGLMIYNNTTNKLNFYNGSAWEAVTSSV